MPIVQILAITVFVVSGIITALLLSARRQYLRKNVNEQIKERVILKIAVPRRNEKSPLAAEQLLTALHGLGMNRAKSADHFSVEIAAGNYGIHFIAVVDPKYKSFFENQIYAQYPEAQITQINDYANLVTATPGNIEMTELTLTKSPFLPIRTFPNFEVDPLAGITGAVSNLPAGQEVFIQFISRPIGDSWQQRGRDFVNNLKGKTDAEGNKSGMESGQAEMIKFIEGKCGKVGFQFVIRILAKSGDTLTSSRLINEVLAAFSQYRTATLNSLGKPAAGPVGWQKFKQDFARRSRAILLGRRLGEQISPIEKFQTRYLDEFSTGIINTEELASLYHLPNKSVETPNISWARSKKLEYPLDLPTQEARILGETDYRGVHVRFGIKAVDRLRHMYVIGKTGTGKSTFMEGMVMADIYDGQGVAVIDPHGEMIQNLLRMIPPHRMEDVVIFDPGDIEFPVGFNLLHAEEGEDKSLIADGIVSVFKKEFSNSWGPRLEYILTNAILTLLHCQNVSLLVLPRLLSDDNYRTFLLKQLKDPILMKFWKEEYGMMDPRKRADEISSILNKVGRFTTNPIIRNITGQVISTFDIKDIMDQGKILFVNLSQGKIGEENMSLLGGMLVTRIYTNVTRRITQLQENRRPFYLYIDEFQNFSTSTFEKILSEARKFGLSLTIAHQFIDQIEEGVRNAIFGNVGTMVSFGVGPKDAEYLAKEYAPYLLPEDLANLGKHEIVVKLSIDIAQSKPFTARTLLPNFPQTNITEQVLASSHRKYAKPRDQMELKLFKWAEQRYNREGNLMTKEEIERADARKEQRAQEKENKGFGGGYQGSNNRDFHGPPRPPVSNNRPPTPRPAPTQKPTDKPAAKPLPPKPAAPQPPQRDSGTPSN